MTLQKMNREWVRGLKADPMRFLRKNVVSISVLPSTPVVAGYHLASKVNGTTGQPYVGLRAPKPRQRSEERKEAGILALFPDTTPIDKQYKGRVMLGTVYVIPTDTSCNDRSAALNLHRCVRAGPLGTGIGASNLIVTTEFSGCTFVMGYENEDTVHCGHFWPRGQPKETAATRQHIRDNVAKSNTLNIDYFITYEMGKDYSPGCRVTIVGVWQASVGNWQFYAQHRVRIEEGTDRIMGGCNAISDVVHIAYGSMASHRT